MDSITQIVLGAACGEAVLGKKIGNKALLFGAIGGTIPDLDVFIGNLLYSNQIDAMLFHRGFMHSIFFAFIGAFVFGWFTYWLYNKGKLKASTTQKDWILLFFWSLFTHPILDAFTPYGTQLFAPFSDYRVALNNISVADPAYTLPFLLCMIILMFYKRTSSKRKLWWKIGVGISSAYMLFTLVNKISVDNKFKATLSDENISYTRFSVQPSLLNNILWYGIAETEDSYYAGFYSLLDSSERFSDWEEIPKTHDLDKDGNGDIASLAWFSNDYYLVESAENDSYRYMDLRYPLIKKDGKSEAVFFFVLKRLADGRLDMLPYQPRESDMKSALQSIWDRLKGK